MARLNRLAALTLIVAPAGYGKTTLVSTWLAQLTLPTTWLSLGAEDNEPAAFLTALVAAVATQFVGFGESISETLRAPQGASFAELSVQLINEMNGLEADFVLVLDDYHVIREPAIHQLLLDLMAYPPRSLHLVLIARHDPPLPWRIRTRSDLCELRAGDLSFTAEEGAQFLAQAAARPIAAPEAHALVEQAQGWITSLRVLALTMRRQTPGTSWSDFAGMELRSFDTFFSSEVLADLDPAMLRFLRCTSILEPLCGSLCDFVVEPAPGDTASQPLGAALLQKMESAGAFTAALDDEGVWYRYHPLLRNVLHRHLLQTTTAAELAGLYKRASAWHEQQGMLDEALAYLLAGEQHTLAIAFVQRYQHQLLNLYDWRRLERWLQQFPEEMIDRYFELLLVQTWIDLWHHEVKKVGATFDHLEAMWAAKSPDTPDWLAQRGELLSLRSALLVMRGEAEAAIEASLAALDDLPLERFWIRTFTVIYLMLSLQMAGRYAEAAHYVAKYAVDPATPADLNLARTIVLRAYINLPQTHLADIQTEGPKLMALLSARTYATTIAWAHYFLGCAYYLQNDQRGAADHFGAVLDLADYAHTITYMNSAIGMALSYEAQGRSQQATAVVEGAKRILSARNQHYAYFWLEAFAAELAARQGEPEAALRWVEREAQRVVFDCFPMFYAPALSLVRVLLAGGTEEQLAAASRLLQRQSELAERTHNILIQVQCQALAAALHAAGGQDVEAEATLVGALALAEPGQIVRVFLDLAQYLAPLFANLAAVAPLGEFAARVHNALQMEGYRRGLAAEAPEPSPRARSSSQAGTLANTRSDVRGMAADVPPHLQTRNGATGLRDLQELLTYREMDVLKLLEQRLTNKEIGHILGISTETVRQHTVNLFRKLNVSNRRQAIVAARNWRPDDNDG
jgi:LuxR family maltose regulon positive regulatory protein